jgi:hypothetical protein
MRATRDQIQGLTEAMDTLIEVNEVESRTVGMIESSAMMKEARPKRSVSSRKRIGGRRKSGAHRCLTI